MSDPGDDHKTESALIKTFLNLEEIDPLLYRSTHLFKPALERAVFGGQVVGQSLVAASNTVDKGREANSMHCYFLKPGKLDCPILYHVLKIKDGMMYSNRFVRATQQDRTIFTTMVSFKEAEADNYSHQFVMPRVPGPEELMDSTQILKQQLGNKDIDEKMRFYIEKRLTEERTMTMKPVDPRTILMQENLPAKRCLWLKVNGHIGDNEQMQRCAAAYMSDSYLLVTAMLPGATQLRFGKVFMTSIDHSIWFHHHIKADDWLLCEIESPKCGEGRALTHGRFWNRKGTLLMSASQEGVAKPFDKSWKGPLLGPDVDQGRKAGHVGGPGGGGPSSVGPSRRYSTASTVAASARYIHARQAEISAVMRIKNVVSVAKRLVRCL